MEVNFKNSQMRFIILIFFLIINFSFAQEKEQIAIDYVFENNLGNGIIFFNGKIKSEKNNEIAKDLAEDYYLDNDKIDESEYDKHFKFVITATFKKVEKQKLIVPKRSKNQFYSKIEPLERFSLTIYPEIIINEKVSFIFIRFENINDENRSGIDYIFNFEDGNLIDYNEVGWKI